MRETHCTDRIEYFQSLGCVVALASQYMNRSIRSLTSSANKEVLSAPTWVPTLAVWVDVHEDRSFNVQSSSGYQETSAEATPAKVPAGTAALCK